MNLHAVVSGAISAVNPPVAGLIYVSAGSLTEADGSRVPMFAAPVAANLQVQALSGEDLRHLDNLNLQGIMRAVYIMGGIEGIDRNTGKGGDILAFQGQYWLVSQVLEPWNDSAGWTKVACTLQIGKPAGIP